MERCHRRHSRSHNPRLFPNTDCSLEAVLLTQVNVIHAFKPFALARCLRQVPLARIGLPHDWASAVFSNFPTISMHRQHNNNKFPQPDPTRGEVTVAGAGHHWHVPFGVTGKSSYAACWSLWSARTTPDLVSAAANAVDSSSCCAPSWHSPSTWTPLQDSRQQSQLNDYHQNRRIYRSQPDRLSLLWPKIKRTMECTPIYTSAYKHTCHMTNFHGDRTKHEPLGAATEDTAKSEIVSKPKLCCNQTVP